MRAAHARGLARRVLRPRPEEPAQAVTLGSRHDVGVEVRDALAHDVVHRDERALRAERRRDGGGDALHGVEERPDVVRARASVTTWSRGTTSTCPGNSGERSRNATATSTSRTTSASASPATIAQNGHGGVGCHVPVVAAHPPLRRRRCATTHCGLCRHRSPITRTSHVTRSRCPRSGAIGGRSDDRHAAQRVVLDTSVLIADPGVHRRRSTTSTSSSR